MLDERIKSRIPDNHKKLTADGELPSSSQLEGDYRTFRSDGMAFRSFADRTRR